MNATTTTSNAQPLIIASLKGGDPNGLQADDTIWTDLEPCDGPDIWRVLVDSHDTAEVCANNAMAELVGVEEWDGSAFGDGAIGTVTSPRPGVLVCGHSEFCGDLPDGWVVASEEYENDPVTNTSKITDEQIEALRDEAIKAGDDLMASLCNEALRSGSPTAANARQACAAAIADAAAMDDEIDPADYSVYGSDTAHRYDGTPTLELVEASIAAGPEGHVRALKIGDSWVLAEHGMRVYLDRD